jgi:hypothetical protein
MTTPSSERRLTTRVHAVWKKIAGGGYPRRSQIDPRDFGTDWSNCMMIDLDQVTARSRFAYLGNALRDPTWPTFDRQAISECLDGTLLELVTRHIQRVTVKKQPVSFGGSARHDESEILYRTVLLPLSEHGDRIDGILAAIAYREVTVAEELPLTEAAALANENLARRPAVRQLRSNGAGAKQ